MTRTYQLTLMLIVLAALAACAQGPSAAEISEIEDRLTSLEVDQRIAEEYSKLIDARVFALESMRDGPVILMLDGDARPIDVWPGRLLVLWDDIVALGDGSRITLRIGNPLQGSMQGVTITAEWDGDVSGSMQTKEADTLHAGSWNDVQFRIPNVKPDQIKTLRIKLETNNILLMQR